MEDNWILDKSDVMLHISQEFLVYFSIQPKNPIENR